jgi:hypothetical protein
MAPGKVDAADKKSPPGDDGAISDEDLSTIEAMLAESIQESRGTDHVGARVYGLSDRQHRRHHLGSITRYCQVNQRRQNRPRS